MLQNLLIERFRIRLHHETRMFRSYDLVVAPGGPKLKKSADPEGVDAVIEKPKIDSEGFAILPPGHGHVSVVREGGVYVAFRNYSIEELVRTVLMPEAAGARGTGVPIEDKTGLIGRYDFRLRYRPQASLTAGPARAAEMAETEAPSGLPDIFKAVEQLGLRLVGGKQSPVDLIVIDHAEKMPAAN